MQTWQSVWEKICKMTYEEDTPYESIIIYPGQIKMSYEEEDTLDYTWRIYSKKHGLKIPVTVPEFKELYVPRHLFLSLGIKQWFQHSFPNCKVDLWE